MRTITLMIYSKYFPTNNCFTYSKTEANYSNKTNKRT